MTDREKLEAVRAEIERRKSLFDKLSGDETTEVGRHFLDLVGEMDCILSFIDSLQEEPSIPEIVDEHYWEMLGEESVSEDLEEAADNYAGVNYDCENEANSFYHMVQKDAFRAGANWQKQKDEKDESDTLLISYMDGVEKGKKQMREQMLKDAIDAEASYTMSVPCITISLPNGVKVGDKVKIIIVK